MTPAMGRGTCRACPAEVLWTTTQATGKPMPVDPEPVPDGNVVLRGHVSIALKKGEDPGPDEPRYKSHFATCPRAGGFRRR